MVEREALEQALWATVRMGDAKGNSFLVEIDLQNLSAKTITAYDVIATARYTDGSERTRGRIEDILLETALTRMPGATVPFSRGTLVSYGVRHITELFPAGEGGAPPAEVTVKAVAIVFEDRTAIGSQSAIRTILDGRKQASDDEAYVLGEIQKAAARPDVAERSGREQDAALFAAIGERVKEIRAASPQPGVEAGRATMLQAFYNALGHSRPGFDFMVSTHELAQHLFTEHSTLEATK